MQTAATEGIDGSMGFGRTALAHIAMTLPTVSAPSRVVRSMLRIARSSAQSFDSRLIERFASEAETSRGEAVSELWGIARFKFREGQLAEFNRLSAQAMEIVRTKDSGPLR